MFIGVASAANLRQISNGIDVGRAETLEADVLELDHVCRSARLGRRAIVPATLTGTIPAGEA